MIPLESVLKDIYLLVPNQNVDEDLIIEFAFRALEYLSVSKTYDYAVCVLEVKNNQAPYPYGMLGIDHVLYHQGVSNATQRRLVIRDLITDIRDVNWHTVEVDYHYEAKVTNFVGLGQTLHYKGWQYLNLSDNNFDKSIICNPHVICNNACHDWWYPDNAKNRFITSFESGLIAVTYYRYPQDEEGKYLIPNTPFMKDAILNYVLAMLYMKLWLSNVEGAETKYKEFNKKWTVTSAAAIGEHMKLSMPEYILGDRINTLFKKDSARRLVGGYGWESKNMM